MGVHPCRQGRCRCQPRHESPTRKLHSSLAIPAIPARTNAGDPNLCMPHSAQPSNQTSSELRPLNAKSSPRLLVFPTKSAGYPAGQHHQFWEPHEHSSYRSEMATPEHPVADRRGGGRLAGLVAFHSSVLALLARCHAQGQ
ncbi:hypothetical protein AvCA_25430 [Azotobacter vinelandii CA]|uniref:Uncharacterized protein n=2 Tax=Azotobacter vinelandii TaxID=354 RepID=C1DIP4_AZOVD|nr:hypothetical protein Avin_25430 [Azotobacter vinelandii DJ]AGK14931.1 hypothetical protein AvCA_25430 [Azotobacter vinelandii CA]AGK20690.1 hypothetical protein AvCA6_25430 [Azotobacter vinelandii CA6]